MMLLCIEMPQERHLQEVYHIITYLKKFNNPQIVINPFYPFINTDNFIQHNWTNFNKKLKEKIVQDTPDLF